MWSIRTPGRTDRAINLDLVARNKLKTQADALQAASGANYEWKLPGGALLSAAGVPRPPAAYANSSRPARRPNAHYKLVACDECNFSTLFVRATRALAPGDEVLCSYAI